MILNGDNLAHLQQMGDNTIDTIITDPPYGLQFMGKKWDYDVPTVDLFAELLRVAKPGAMLLCFGGSRTFHRIAVNIEDAGWELRDTVMYLYGSGFPKGHNIYKALRKNACSCTMGVGSTPPYNHEAGKNGKAKTTEQKAKHNVRPMRQADLSQAVSAKDKQGEVLQSCLPQQGSPPEKSLSATDEGQRQSGLERWSNVLQKEGQLQKHQICESAGVGETDGTQRRLHNGTSVDNGPDNGDAVETDRGRTSPRPRPVKQRPEQSGVMAYQFSPQKSGTRQVCEGCGKPIADYSEWDGWNVALKPAHEPILVAMKPLDGTFADNAEKWHVAGLWIDGGRVGYAGNTDKDRHNQSIERYRKGNGSYENSWANASPIENANPQHFKGRWPANVITGYPEDEYQLRDGITPEQKRELYQWMVDNT